MIDGIEYNEYPPPSSVIKGTESKWAYKLRDSGEIRLNYINFYHNLENPDLGDKNEGRGMLRVNGHPMESGSINEVFVWCSALDSTPHATLKSFKTNYDTVIQITDPIEFTKRIRKTAKDKGYDLMPHLGQIQYNRGDEVTNQELNSQKWHANVFQKECSYSHQQEYRFAFSNYTFDEIGLEYLDLILGNCSGIIKIIT